MEVKTINTNNDPYDPVNQTVAFIEESLEGFYEIDNIDFIPLGSIVRYLIYSNKYHKYIFRLGSVIIANTEDKVLFAGVRHRWNVPKIVKCYIDETIYNTRFFKLESNEDKYEDALLQQESAIEDKDAQIIEFKKQIISLKKELKSYKDFIQQNFSPG